MSVYDRISSREPGDLDLTGADAALLRAAQRVRREAAALGRTVVVFKDGEIVWEKPSREYLPQGLNIDGEET